MAGLWWQPDAARQVPRPRRRRLAPRRRGARGRRPRDRRRRGRHATPRATSSDADDVAVDGRAGPGGRQRAGRLPAQQARRRRLDRAATPHGPPDGRRPRPRRARGSTRSAASTPTRPACILLTNDGELANRLTHPSLRGAEDLPRARCAARPCAAEALRALREGVELDDGRTAPARVRRLAPDVLEITHPRGPQAPGAPHVRGGRAPGRARSSACAFGPLRLGDLPVGGYRRSRPPRSSACGTPACETPARPPDARSRADSMPRSCASSPSAAPRASTATRRTASSAPPRS